MRISDWSSDVCSSDLAQGQPDYISAVTEEPEEGSFALDGVDLGDDSPDAQLFRKACQLVFENQKASTSWLQRQLRVGYNSAARLIEQMEEQGLVGPPNHVGRRAVQIGRAHVSTPVTNAHRVCRPLLE